MKTGEIIRSKRRALNTMTLARLANRLGCSVGHISDIETGKVSPRINELRLLSGVLGCAVVDLLGDEPVKMAEDES